MLIRRNTITNILILVILTVFIAGSYTYAAKTGSTGFRIQSRITDVQYISDEAGEAVKVLVESYRDFSSFTLTGPHRIVLDIYNAEGPFKQQLLKAGGKVIERIRFAQFEPYTARVVLEIKQKADYMVEETEDGILLCIGEKPAVLMPPDEGDSEGDNSQDTEQGLLMVQDSGIRGDDWPFENDIRNIEYSNTGDRVYFTLKNAVLTEGDEFLEELYLGSYDEENNYTITFKTGDADLGNGIMEIKDKYLDMVLVRTIEEKGITKLTFFGTGKNSYLVFTRNNPLVTTITVLVPAEKSQKIVVIDAGHGGKDCGASYKNVLEKDLNLDIAQRLNALLKDQGVETYMIRDEDIWIPNYERAYIANALDASLYLSVHNNAMVNQNQRGTMTLYCPSVNPGFTGKNFAEIIHKNMLGTLKTIDKKIVGRPDLIVLKATIMPAAIAEVAFISNSSDRANLQDAAFRQKAAKALFDSVLQALKKV